jgi:molybdopterin-guanine dinucleotide biosynthesis protein A
MPQYQYVYQLLRDLLGSAYLSCNPDRIPEGDWNIVADASSDMGPLSGLMAAFQKHPDHAWMAVACDLPLLDMEALQFLLERRDPAKLATCFHDKSSGMPEPMIAIWEPAVYPYLLDQSRKGMSLRKILLQPEVLQIQPRDPGILINANTPEEMMDIKKKIHHSR